MWVDELGKLNGKDNMNINPASVHICKWITLNLQNIQCLKMYPCIKPGTRYLSGDTACFSLKLKLEANFQRRHSVKHVNWFYDESFSQVSILCQFFNRRNWRMLWKIYIKNIKKREKRCSSSLIVLILQLPQRPIRRFHKKSLLTKPEASQWVMIVKDWISLINQDPFSFRPNDERNWKTQNSLTEETRFFIAELYFIYFIYILRRNYCLESSYSCKHNKRRLAVIMTHFGVTEQLFPNKVDLCW